jgi:hypothetical protein
MAYFGFCANPNHTLQATFDKAVREDISPLYLLPTNLAFYNPCTLNTVPPGTRQLLGFNLKYCLASRKLPNNIHKTNLKMAYSIRTKHYLIENNLTSDAKNIKQIYK